MGIGSYDSILRILHLRTSTCVSSLSHSRSSLLSSLHVYRLNTCSSGPPKRSIVVPPSTPSRYKNKTVGKTPGRGGRMGGKEQRRGLETPSRSKFSSRGGVPPSPSPNASMCSSSFVQDVEERKEEMFLVVDGGL